MKQLFMFVLLSVISLGSVFAQCSTVNVETFGPTTQTGAHNYFGVRASLQQTYYQDVTITGYIHRDVDEWNNTDHPFTLVIPAGELSAETSAFFYQTDPTAGADVTITSISPCPPMPIAVLAKAKKANAVRYTAIHSKR